MTLYELGNEYEQRAIELTLKIHELNKELKCLGGERKVAMRRRIFLLYQDAFSCRQTAKKLREYYERRNLNGQDYIKLGNIRRQNEAERFYVGRDKCKAG